MSRQQQALELQKQWDTDPRWTGIKRGYTADDVVRLRGSIAVEHTLAKRGAESSGGSSTRNRSSMRWARSQATRRCSR